MTVPVTATYRQLQWDLAQQIADLVKAECEFWPDSAAKLREEWDCNEESFKALLTMRWPLHFACEAAATLGMSLKVSRAPTPPQAL